MTQYEIGMSKNWIVMGSYHRDYIIIFKNGDDFYIIQNLYNRTIKKINVGKINNGDVKTFGTGWVFIKQYNSISELFADYPELIDL